MTYRVIGLMSGSSLDGLDIVFAELHVAGNKWNFEILASETYAYDAAWVQKLRNATALNAAEYQLLHVAYGHYIGAAVNRFIDAHNLHYKVALIASHGHTTFHMPQHRMTAQLGDGAAIAAVTGLPVVSDLRALDLAFGGQGAPIVPMGERLLFPEYDLLLNLGGIANISIRKDAAYLAYDICPANRVLNELAAAVGKSYDEGGALAASGKIDYNLLAQLNDLDYYAQAAPKSLANSYGTDVVLPLVQQSALAPADALRTYVAHIAGQVATAVGLSGITNARMLVTGGGAFNTFLVHEINAAVEPFGVLATVPDAAIVNSKEALIMALLGVLRWRQEATVLASVTGASRDSIGGAVWIGQEP